MRSRYIVVATALAAVLLGACVGRLWATPAPAAGTARTGMVTATTADSGSATTPPAPNPPSAAPSRPLAVRVAGNRLVDAGGAVVRLLGVNRSGTQYACVEGYGVFDGPSDQASVDAIASWGVTAVRVSLNEQCWLGLNGLPASTTAEAYRSAVTGYVDLLIRAGMYVVLDLHWNAPGGTRAMDQQPMADRDHAPAFWSSVAAAFKDHPAVMFDLYNEPYPDDNRDTEAAWTCVRDGGACPGVDFTAAGSQELLDAVRGAGATNVVLVGGPQYAGSLTRWAQYRPHDPAGQLAASVHIYYNTTSDPEWSPCYASECWAQTLEPLAATTPVVIGEVGEHDCASGLLMPLLNWADAHDLSYLAWSWIAGDCAKEPALVSRYDGTPSGAGAGYRAHLLQQARPGTGRPTGGTPPTLHPTPGG
ncbi:glycoside hydrolase family 5 protein [Pedococcus sp. 2YAF34]|uniref:glycoside hydrolase family 5 protein n=1 Tax=Pedococcus sp. 2YAF34 TaxID=3233032 RepID=UPI003F9D9CFC